MLKYFLVLILPCLVYSQEIYALVGMKPPKDLALEVLRMDNFQDFLICAFWVSIFHISSYFIVGTFLVFTNPIPIDAYRKSNIIKEIKMGAKALLYVVIVITLWMWKFEQKGPFYGYYLENPFTVVDFFKTLIAYMIAFDTWFYWTHQLLHIPFFWNTIHYQHHSLIEPTAFAHDAVHPFEAVLQGPLGHIFATLVYPQHPAYASLFGFATSIYALLAHDGRKLDLNGHQKHHHYKSCNYGLYWGLWDYICGTRYSKQKFPVEYIPTWERNKNK